MNTAGDRPLRRVLTVVRWPVGGIRTHLLDNYRPLVARGYRFTFVGPDDQSFRAFSEEVAKWEGSEFIPAPLKGQRCAFFRPVRKLLKTRRFAVVHSHGIKAAAQVALANLGLHVPHVLTSHDVFLPRHSVGFIGRLKLNVLSHVLRRIDVIVSVGQDVQTNFLEYMPGLASGPARLTVIRNGIDPDRITGGTPGKKDWLRQRLHVSQPVCLVGFLGRFMEQKGFLPLLDAVSRLARDSVAAAFHLVAVGSGDFEREYQREVVNRGLGRLVSFLDFSPTIGSILHELDLLVVPSLWEACPLLPMEAMVAGVPVLGSDCIGLREVLRDTPSIIVPAGNTEAWCNALREAIAAPWKEEAIQFAPAAVKRFHFARAAVELERLFEEVTPVSSSARSFMSSKR